MNASKMELRKRITARQSSQVMSIPPFTAYQPMPAVRIKKKPPMTSRTKKRAAATGKKSTKTASNQGLMLNANDDGGPESAGIAGPGRSTMATWPEKYAVPKGA
mmetsp:Transcript_53194/g.99764  ORF Transcript_53194/g.99764 Transcript_53194/m.99764 type:complete len:104 (+) Transcript_53194:480-791(+)